MSRLTTAPTALSVNAATAALLVADALGLPLSLVLMTAGSVFLVSLHLLRADERVCAAHEEGAAATPLPCAQTLAAPPAAARRELKTWGSQHSPSQNAALMARVSHEIRTPLNAVIGFSDVMSRELLGPLGNPRYQEYACHVRDCGRELLKSAEDTLAMTALMSERLRSCDLSAVDLAPFAAEAWAFYAEEAATRGITLQTDVEAGLEALAERRTLRQILINLLADALHVAATGDAIVLTARADGDLVEVCVSVPVAPARLPSSDGSLPLCLAKAMLELQGSSLLEVYPDAGTRLVVTALDRAVQRDLFACA